MSRSKSAASQSDRRRKARINVSGLEVSIELKRWKIFKEYVECNTTNINQGGIGIIASDLKLLPFQKVRLKMIYHGDSYLEEEYYITGTVAYQYQLDGLEFYGITFIQVPPQFDSLIEKWFARTQSEEDRFRQSLPLSETKAAQKALVKGDAVFTPIQTPLDTSPVEPSDHDISTQVADTSEDGTRVVFGTQRRIENRYPVSGLKVKVRNRGLMYFADFVEGDGVDISLGGISFATPKDAGRLVDRVRLEILYKEKVLRADGLVSYFSARETENHYGVQFTMVPLKLASLVKIIQLAGLQN